MSNIGLDPKFLEPGTHPPSYKLKRHSIIIHPSSDVARDVWCLRKLIHCVSECNELY